jgi:predicted PurR-regulated permease PerM
MGTLGGLELLGLLGLFVGPVALALSGALWQDWIRNRAHPLAPSLAVTIADHA